MIDVLQAAAADPNPAAQVTETIKHITWTGVGWGCVILAVAIAIGMLVRHTLTWVLLNWVKRSESSARVLGKLAQAAVIVLGVGAALAYVFPSIKPVNLVGGLGVVSIAAGIAFQTVLGNMFAGLVILWRQTPVVGDQISVEGVSGTITTITLSHTTVHTFDGRQVLIPNGVLHKSMVTVQTEHPWIRSSFTIKIRNPEQFRRAREVAIAALGPVPQVLDNPPPVAVLRQVADGMATMEVRFWSGSQQFETVTALDLAILAVLDALRAESIAFGPDNVVVLSDGGE
ncbi:mechanosensitive ion channel family protein [Corynebacterium choanae]|uniref:Small-conductance mechanosensitive channel n=1 Tax=Corynebacterium choanae TaxID=1862358 RepID=A0A3G6JCK4_9CORY|nr:mechanosensitive ion channel domain-containing protein [Corynebacterium choanae]AZA14390.1 Small-conductance mechanosensitive channel [Corynebacterium choanae]